jgi:hypothetical protein
MMQRLQFAETAFIMASVTVFSCVPVAVVFLVLHYRKKTSVVAAPSSGYGTLV